MKKYCNNKNTVNNNQNNDYQLFGKEETFLKMLKLKKLNINDIINLLKTSNLDLNKLDNHGYNILHYTIKQEQPEIINLILNLDDNYQTLKADPNILCNDSINGIFLSPLLLSLVHCNDSSNSSKIIKSLIRSGADITTKDDEGSTLLLKSCEKGRIDILEYLENKSSEENAINWNETSKYGGAIHMAIIGDQEDVVNYLLEKKIDINIKDENKNSILHLSLQFKNFNVFKLIIDYVKSNVNMIGDDKKEFFASVNDEENTILHELAYAQSSHLTDYIIKNNDTFGVDMERKNKQNYTYVDVQKNIIRIKKEREEMEKKKREFIRQEKERIAEELRKENENRRKMEDEEIMEKEKIQEFRLKLLSYRNYIFLVAFILFTVILYFLIDSKIKTKKSPNII